MTKSIKDYILTEGFETPNQLKMWKDHIEGLKIYNYPLQKNEKWNSISNTFDIDAWEEDWDDTETPEKIALKDKMYMKGALRENNLYESYAVVRAKDDKTHVTYIPLKKGRASDDLDAIRENGKFTVITYYKNENDARDKVKELQSKIRKKKVSEEFEQIDELSKPTIANYIRRASKDVAQKGYELGSDGYNKKRDKKLGQRQYNIGKAADRLANESVDPEAKLKEKISKMNVNQLKDIIKKLNDMNGSDEDVVFDFATAELEKKMPSKEYVKFMNQLDESVINEGSDKFNYLVKIDDVDPKFYEKLFGRQLGDFSKIKEFLKGAKKYTVDAKGKSTLAAVKKEIKERKPTQYYAKWQADSSSYKDDSVDLYYKD